MVAVPQQQYGYFYSGDSYIVLNEIVASSGDSSYDLHMWIGKSCLFFGGEGRLITPECKWRFCL